jgi:YidC/Oxa1 family membrane protein insertase
MQNNRNTILFFLLSGLIILASWVLLPRLMPPGNQHAARPGDSARVANAPEKEPDKEGPREKAPDKKQPEQPAVTPPPPAPAPPAEPEPPAHEPITLGNPITDFFVVTLDSRGASVTKLTMRDFQAADENGQPEWLDPAHTQKKPLELIQARSNRDEGSFLLYDADPAHDERPYSRLGKRQWKVDEIHHRDDGTVDRVVFSTQVGGVRVSKVYSLNPGDYHLGLEVKLENTTDRDVKFRYHLASAHGQPIEGEYFTYTLRNAVVGTVDDRGNAWRNLQDLRRIAVKAGGEEVPREGKAIQYGGVTNQYFSSLVAVSKEDVPKKFLSRARPTIVTAVLRGKVTDARDPGKLEVTTADHIKFTVLLPDDAELTPEGRAPQAGDPVSLVYRTDDRDRLVARQVYTGADADRLLFDDINVHLVSDAIDLKPGAAEVHHYLLYNGPVKVALLDYMDANQRPSAELVNHYLNDLHLNTVTDSPSPGWFGDNVWGPTGWTWLIIHCTNLMHLVLWLLHNLLYWVPWNQGLAILLLTVMVRGMMFPLSRRQAMMSIKMQALAPEIKKLQEKYKDDRQALGMAQMELYRKHGVNPIGSCWTIFLQMPIFLGLYYALQESIRFRLSPLLWINNLAAPDMLFYWGSSIPWISRPESYGTMFYLGPYFNLLPVIVAGMMLVQQKMMTPPPTDEQQEMQQKMMKFMTVFFALMFYKLAAGLCLYFITSSLWGFAERKLLPKRKPDGPGGAAPQPGSNSLLQKAYDRLQALSPQRADSATNVTAAPSTVVQDELPGPGGLGKRGKKARRKERERRRNEASGGNGAGATPPGGPFQGDGSSGSWWADARRRVRAWWQQLLREAKKK